MWLSPIAVRPRQRFAYLHQHGDYKVTDLKIAQARTDPSSATASIMKDVETASLRFHGPRRQKLNVIPIVQPTPRILAESSLWMSRPAPEDRRPSPKTVYITSLIGFRT